MRIGIVPVGKVPTLEPKIIAAHVAGYLDLEALVLPSVALPAEALDRQRLQYNAGQMLTALETLPFSAYRKLVGVVNVDIFLPIFTHVFGEARQGGRWALVSLYQLAHQHGSAPVESVPSYDRAAKIALHEIGHLFNLPHCDDPCCLMHFSGSLEDLDRLPFDYCRYCRTFFTEARDTETSKLSPI
jgi:archaemetzincin